MNQPSRFNVRVYGLCIQNNAILIAEELHHKTHMRKFPGGGLEFGEDIRACLKREWREELDVEIEVLGDVFYINDFLITSRFDPSDQVLAIFFKVKMLEESGVRLSESPMDFESASDGDMSFRFVPLDELSSEFFTFPADQAVVRKLLNVP